MYTYIQSNFWKHWLASLLLVMGVGMFMLFYPPVQVPDLIAIEFAPSAFDLSRLIQKINYIRPLYYNTLTDFIFIFAYTLLFYFSGRILCDLLEFYQTQWLFLFSLPMLCDMIENFLLIDMLLAIPEDYSAFCFFYWAVRLKWLLVIPGILSALLVLLFQAYVGIDRVYCWWKEVFRD